LKAFILAAGFGTRLKPLTDKIPKALISYKGEAMINHQIKKLKNLGVNYIVVNAHHYADEIENYLKNNNFGVEIIVIKEKVILGTGGGILNALEFLKKEKYFIVLNVDIETDFELNQLLKYHISENPLATLAVQRRYTARSLEFNEDLNFIGRATINTEKNNKYAFNGMHIISSKIFNYNFKIEYCDIIDIYLKAISLGEKIKGYDVGDKTFKDLGKIENLVD